MKFLDDLQKNGWTTPKIKREEHIRRYSTTSDILAYKRCSRQYGMFNVRHFPPAHDTQAYFGTLTHDVMDAINREYRATGALPERTGIEQMVEQAHERLWRSGVRPYNSVAQRRRVILLIERFLKLTGEAFFKNVRETEYELEHAMTTHKGRDYVLHGIVDVLAGSISNDLGLSYSTNPADVEIWDYKSGRQPEKNEATLHDYEYQMRMYAEMYRLRTGSFPARCVLVFMGELADEDAHAFAKGRASHFPKLFYPIDPNPDKIAAVEGDFHQTVENIEDDRAKPYEHQWAPPPSGSDAQTCAACDLRYNCAGYPEGLRACL